jgi:tRNA (cytidine/uridine-2'-O-)-methyltransferase
LWLVRPLGFSVDDARLRRAGLDYWKHLAWEVVDDWTALTGKLPDARRWCFSKTAERSFQEVEYRQGDALVFGCETQGLPQSILHAESDRAVRIPMRPEARSLNLSVAAAVAVFEATRQIGG